MVKRKGAFQLSLGFIVAVVFAVILLSLAIAWINSIFPQITKITDDLTQEARQELRDIFSGSDSKFSVYPEEWELERGHELKMLAGIINKNPDSQTHRYVINVIPTKPETEDWIDNSEFKNPLPTPFGDDVFFPITISPKTQPTGTFTFYVIACEDKSFAECQDFDDQNYDSPQYFRISLV